MCYFTRSLGIILIFVLGLCCYAQEQQKDAVLPILLNTIPGFGLGSFIQEDFCGGIILLVADIGAGGCLATGMILAMGSIFGEVITLGGVETNPCLQAVEPLVITGACIMLLSKLFGIIRPIWFSLEYRPTDNQSSSTLNSVYESKYYKDESFFINHSR